METTSTAACVICFEHERLATRYFMPCRCRIMVCDSCIENVEHCLYHRQKAREVHADENAFTFHRLVRMAEIISGLNQNQRQLVEELQAMKDNFWTMRNRVLLNSVGWAFTILLKDAACSLLRNQTLSFVLSLLALFVNIVFLHQKCQVSYRIIHNMIWWTCLLVVASAWCYAPYHEHYMI